MKSTQKRLSPLELALMERRFDRMKQNDALRANRREKNAGIQSKGSQWATKKVAEIRANEALAVANRANAKAENFTATVRTPTPHVVVRSPLDDPKIPIKFMSMVFEVGATIGSRVTLDIRNEALAGENNPSLMLSISKLGTEDFKVYPSFEAGKAAADKENETLNAYMRTLAKANTEKAAA